MKNIITIIVAILFMSCNNTTTISNDSGVSEEQKAIFERNVNTFKNGIVKGFKEENVGVSMEMFADSLKWNNPEAILGGESKSYQDLKDVLTFYMENFDNITFKDDVYFGGSLYSSNEPSDSPNAVRVFGNWNTVHTESQAKIEHKWMGILWFNEDGKVYQFSDFFDVSGLALQIEGTYKR